MDDPNFLLQLEEYAKELADNSDSKTPLVHAPVVHAYQISAVREAIANRLSAGQILVRSTQTIPDIVMNRERAYFEFAPSRRMDTRLPGILVQLNDDNSLQEIIDPFYLERSDEIITRPQMGATLPLCAASSNPIAPQKYAHNLEQRWNEFAQQTVFDSFRATSSRRAINLGSIFGGFGNVFGGTGTSTADTWTGGIPYPTPVISNPTDKEDPDNGTTGGSYDDSSPDDFALLLGDDYPTHKVVFPGGPSVAKTD